MPMHIVRFLTVLALMLGIGFPAASQTRGGTLNVILNPEPSTLMLGLNQQTPTQVVAGKIYQGLLTYNNQLRPLPGLAREWSVSEDGLTYTFKLQEGVRWHDGKPFTAQDVVFSTKTYLAEMHPRARGNFSRVVDFAAPDPLTVVFRLREPYPPFIYAFEVSSAPIVPRHIYEGTDFRNNPANQSPIGTGPFKFKEWRRGQFVHLVRNDDYFKKGLPYLDEIYFRVIPDAASRLVALESGVAQVASFNDIDFAFMPQIKANPQFETTIRGYEFAAPLAWIEFNQRTKPMDDARFRQAVLHALDRQFIASRIFFGQARPATGPVSSFTRFYEPNVDKYALDTRESERLLDEMGLRRGPDGIRTRLKLLGLPYGESWTRLAEYIRQALGKVGIDVVLESTDAGTWARRYANWEFDMTLTYLYQYGDPALGVSRTYLSSNIRKGVYGSNVSGYANPEVDRLFNAAGTATRESSRQALYSEVQKLLVKEAPAAWLVELQFPTIVNKKFKNVTTTAIGVAESFETTQKAD